MSAYKRMKENYEDRYSYYLPRRTNVIIRVDGAAFHTYTRSFEKPFDQKIVDTMNQTACAMCKDMQGVKFAYTQSDEISFLLTDYDTIETQAWFDNNLQKLVSRSAAKATKYFNYVMSINRMSGSVAPTYSAHTMKLAEFDARVFIIPEWEEVKNYFISRQQDAVRNSISMVAQTLYSHHELQNKKNNQLQEMIFQKGINWNDFDDGLKRGRMIVKHIDDIGEGYYRTWWMHENPPIFTQDKKYLDKIVKGHEVT